MDHAGTIEKNRGILLRCININVHIVACLRAAAVIDQAKESRLEAEKAPHDKLGLLIDWIKESPYTLYESFIEVAEKNEQQHVANLLRGIEENDHVPLSPDRYARLLNIRPKLMYMIHNNVALIAKLISSKAISRTDAEDLSVDKVPNYKKNFRLINAILRRSDYSFECLCAALRETQQTEAADYLVKGETIAVHVNTTRPDLDESLTESLNETFVKEPMDETAHKELEMPQLNGLRIVGASPSHSIVILVYCKTTDNVFTFTQLFNSGDLQAILEDILNRLFKRIEPQSKEKLEASIRLDDEEILTIEEITGIEDWMVKRSERTTSPQSGSLLASYKPTEEEKTHEISSALASSRELRWRLERRALFEDELRWGYERGELREDELRWKDEGRDFHWDKQRSRQQKRRAFHRKFESLLSEEEELFNLLAAKAYSKQGSNVKCVALEQQRKAQEVLNRETQEHRTLIVELPEKYKSDPVLVKTIRTKAAEKKKTEIRGLTILDKELFVVNEWSSEVEVYDSMKFTLIRRWDLNELIDPKDIGSCNKIKCIYIMDYSGIYGHFGEILRADPNGKLLRKWSTEDDYGDSLSVTDESNVILAVNNKNKLNEYTKDGQLIREISLSSNAGICYPWYAIKLANGHFVVSHGFGFFDLQRVCVVDGDGKVKKSFGGNRGLTIGQMNLPFHFAVDEKGFVLVVDRFNSRIVLLNSDLEFKREILSKEINGIRDPRRILLDESHDRLFVADNKLNDGRILIFSLASITLDHTKPFSPATGHMLCVLL